MAPIDDAVAAWKLRDPNSKLTLQTCAENFGVERSTLGRRVRGETRSKTDASAAQQKLNPQQEHELVLYINFAATIP
jgi:hypothetical protein